MKTSLACSLGLHLILMLLVALSPVFRQKVQPPELIIPVNLIALPSPPPAQAAPEPLRAQAVPEPRSIRAEPPRERTRGSLPEAPRISRPAVAPPPGAPRQTRPQDTVIPDLAAKMKVPQETAASLKEKVQTRLRKVEPPSPRPASVRPAKTYEPEPSRPRDFAQEPPSASLPAPAPSTAAGVSPPLPALSTEGVTFPYSWYVAVVQNAIYENWSPPRRLLMLKPGAGVYIRFRISRDGGISEITIRESSGSAILDRSALAAVKGMSALPPLPAEFPGHYLHVVVFFQPLEQ